MTANRLLHIICGTLVLAGLVILGLLIYRAAMAQTVDPTLVETRYFGSPIRNADGTIKRRSDVLKAFQAIHPCPSTGLTTGACPGFAKNHDIPLGCGGADAVSNLTWQSTAAKKLIDAYELKIYQHYPPFPDTARCRFQIVQ